MYPVSELYLWSFESCFGFEVFLDKLSVDTQLQTVYVLRRKLQDVIGFMMKSFMSSDDQNDFFHCTLCDFKIRYDYKGYNPPFFKKEIKLLESVYCIRDPFADDNLGGIILGGDCSSCGKSVCVSQVCVSNLFDIKFRTVLCTT
ncbi:hypothetical protein MN116_004988 [Schistosoma mekongi]|uniref:Cysteine-rich DPF motif domain-containing protein 1 n=1 Tax=Schistosoma mekongi TaxID=38744 RepID=A0AAE1ZCX1_SCHME|nr:hypothetical protein MN116_004988 [Schistosoma mekongi]